MKNHGSELSINKKIMSFQLVSEVESERLFENIWAMLVYEIKKLEEVDGEKPLGVEIFNDTPKTKKEVLSLDINWAVFDQVRRIPLLVFSKFCFTSSLHGSC